jgi:hypothetical protein
MKKGWLTSVNERAEAAKAGANWHSGPVSYEWMIVLGATILVATALIVWAYFFRKRRIRKVKYHYPHGDKSKTRESGDQAERTEHRHRRRRHRRDHRPRNPTRAETGGLPPLHTETPPNPAP